MKHKRYFYDLIIRFIEHYKVASFKITKHNDPMNFNHPIHYISLGSTGSGISKNMCM